VRRSWVGVRLLSVLAVLLQIAHNNGAGPAACSSTTAPGAERQVSERFLPVGCSFSGLENATGRLPGLWNWPAGTKHTRAAGGAGSYLFGGAGLRLSRKGSEPSCFCRWPVINIQHRAERASAAMRCAVASCPGGLAHWVGFRAVVPGEYHSIRYFLVEHTVERFITRLVRPKPVWWFVVTGTGYQACPGA
jgi:hypothetical protein